MRKQSNALANSISSPVQRFTLGEEVRLKVGRKPVPAALWTITAARAGKYNLKRNKDGYELLGVYGFENIIIKLENNS